MKLDFKGGGGNQVCVTADETVYSIQTIRGPEFILQAFTADGTSLTGGAFLGESYDTDEAAKKRAQQIEDSR